MPYKLEKTYKSVKHKRRKPKHSKHSLKAVQHRQSNNSKTPIPFFIGHPEDLFYPKKKLKIFFLEKSIKRIFVDLLRMELLISNQNDFDWPKGFNLRVWSPHRSSSALTYKIKKGFRPGSVQRVRLDINANQRIFKGLIAGECLLRSELYGVDKKRGVKFVSDAMEIDFEGEKAFVI